MKLFSLYEEGRAFVQKIAYENALSVNLSLGIDGTDYSQVDKRKNTSKIYNKLCWNEINPGLKCR